ncbi:MAG TPA: 5-oxoprolinase subunit PxpB, partial [Gemmatimonadales bacterium]|nr:5-oxoprolinase subunit PxpB [Gemmatimonadales bacterium]
MTEARVTPLGDRALTVAWDGSVAVAHPLVRAAAARLEAARLPFVQDLVPAYTTLSVFFDPRDHDYSAASSLVLDLLQGLEPATRASGREVVIPVVYDGPDLTDVARQTGLREAEVVSRHTARKYEVYLVGFAPGWAYLGDLDPSLVLPRRPAPRQRVPAGSVAIAGAQTGVYPFAIPGGWHLIGRTDTVMFDAAR